MLTNSILTIAGLCGLFGVVFIIYGIWLRHLSGFTFYMTAGLLAGLALFGVAALSLVYPDWSDFIFFVGVVIMPITGLWEEAQERRVRMTHPSKWLAWENALAQQHRWAGWLLYPIQRRIH